VALNERQQAFVREYVVDFNATKAAKRAGYAEAGAYQRGYELLKKREIDEAIRKEVDERGRAVHITAERIEQELRDIAMDPEAKRSDRIKALELLGKRHAMFIERQEHGGSEAPIRVVWK
jgi:phage terminase small subunit